MKTDGSDQGTKKDQAKEKPKTIKERILTMTKAFEMALPKTITPERMLRVVMTALQKNSKLAECEPKSFFGAMLTALQLGLEPNTPLGHCYLIPRWDKKIKGYSCSFEMGYQGLLELAWRTKFYRRISARVVYKGDEFSFLYGKNHHLDHKPSWKSKEPIYVYADYELDNGGYDFTVWSWDAIIKHAEQYSESFDSDYSAWKENPEGMGKKTTLRSLLWYGPRSVELAEITTALNSDGKIIIANKVEENGKETVQLDAQYLGIEAPDQKSKDLMNEVQNSSKEKLKDSAIFSQDEAAHLEQQYQQGTTPPDFG
jgi:recombination protein RecT